MVMKILIINGPNLNKLGSREPEIYGSGTFEDYLKILQKKYPEVQFEYFQSNVEGEIINRLHSADGGYQGVIMNPGGYSHTSVSIADAVAAIKVAVIEVHISNIFAREQYRHVSITAAKCIGSVTGLGLQGYELATMALLHR
jgi:3-dehydroquinate dehydratase-2